MPSSALTEWQTLRMSRLADFELDCNSLVAAHHAVPDRAQEYIRSYTVLLCAEFQGFCRDLHGECADLIAAPAAVGVRVLLRSQYGFGRSLD